MLQNYGDLIKYNNEYPGEKNTETKLIELRDLLEKIKYGNLNAYDISKIQKEQKDFFERLRKKEKANLSEQLANNIWLKIDFLRQIGALKNYEEDYNRTLENLSMPSSFRIENKEEFEKELLDRNKLKNFSISELIALNAFWTNRLVKEVERRNEVIYVLENTDNFNAFSEGKEINLKDKDIRHYLAEYRAIVPYITRFKLDGRNRNKEKSIDGISNLAVLDFDINQIFSKDDIEHYNDLEAVAYNVLLLNNRSQLLYDQKDIAIGEMVSLMVNSTGYNNAGISLEEAGTGYKGKSLVVIDLKGFNAPLMLHMNNDELLKRVKKVSGRTEIPVYRGGRDLVIESSQSGRRTAKTNVLFKLNSSQRKDIAARAGVVGAKDTNGRYVTHISWMLNPKKEMTPLIRETRRILDLETGEVKEIDEENERKK